jgi:hypothetical protein
MGGRPSTLRQDSTSSHDSRNPCQRCFLFDPPFRAEPEDAMGSPVPDTPVQRRENRKEYEAAISGGGGPVQNGREVFSSRYDGLEKEAGTNSTSSLASSSSEDTNGYHRAEVHEGKVSFVVHVCCLVQLLAFLGGISLFVLVCYRILEFENVCSSTLLFFHFYLYHHLHH